MALSSHCSTRLRSNFVTVSTWWVLTTVYFIRLSSSSSDSRRWYWLLTEGVKQGKRFVHTVFCQVSFVFSHLENGTGNNLTDLLIISWIFFIFQNHSLFIFCKAVFFITLILAFTQQCSTRIDGTTVISRSLLSNKTKIFTQEISASSSVFLFRRNSSILTNLDCRLFTMIYLVHSQIFKSFLKN